MDEVGEISLALDLYADECSLRDPERNHSVFVKTSSIRLKQEIEDLLYNTLNIDSHIRPMARYLSKYGDFACEIVTTSNRDGVASIKTMYMYNFTRIETKYGDLVGFFYQLPGEKPVYYHPWQVAHVRLIDFEQLYMPYGKAIQEGARRDWRRLRLMEDAALVYRLCLRGDSKVWTPNGHKEIKDIKEGDIVYSYTANGTLKETNVTYSKCNGKDKIYRVYSQHREIFANATHPILVEEPYQLNGQWLTKFKYVDVKDLKTLQNTTKSYCHKFVLPTLEYNEYVKLNKPEIKTYVKLEENINIEHGLSYVGKNNGYKKSSIKNFLNGEHSFVKEDAIAVLDDFDIVDEKISETECWSFDCNTGMATTYDIPDIADEQFAKWFGFMIGDGYISTDNSYNNYVGFACGDKEDVNQFYKSLFEKYVGKLHFYKDEKRLGAYYVCSVKLIEFMKLNGFIGGAANKRVPAWVYKSPRSVQIAFIDGYLDADGTTRMFKGGITLAHELDCCNKKLMEDIKELCHRLGWNVGLVRKHERIGGHIIDKENKSDRILGIEEVGEDLIYDIGVDSDEHNFAVDGILTHNTRAPEKRIFKVPVGNLPPKEREQYIQIIARRFKKHKFIDPVTGAMNEKYAPHIQDDDYWVPVTSDGTGVEIDTLKGAENLDAIADIEYFKKKMISALKIPFNRVGLAQEGSNASKTVAQQSPEFAKAIQWIQDQLIVGIKKITLVHLALRGFSIEDMKDFELSMTSASAIDELYRIETWASRVDIMGGLKELKIFPDEWIVEKFTDLTKDELEVIKRTMDMKKSQEGGGEEGEDFFEDVNVKSLVINERKVDLKEAIEKVTAAKIKFGPHASFNKLLNENEFDGITHNGKKLESGVDKKDQVITEMESFLKDVNSEKVLTEDTSITPADIP
jgi:intein/homing endonuclease